MGHSVLCTVHVVEVHCMRYGRERTCYDVIGNDTTMKHRVCLLAYEYYIGKMSLSVVTSNAECPYWAERYTSCNIDFSFSDIRNERCRF